MAGAIALLLLGGASPVAAGGKTCDKNQDCCNNARCGGKKCKGKSGFTDCGGALPPPSFPEFPTFAVNQRTLLTRRQAGAGAARDAC